MELQLSFKVSDKIYIKDPEQSTTGRLIVKHGIDMIYKLGFESFTFKKLAMDIHITEATVYRYFENKHRLLLYILNWYWSYLEFMMMYKIQGISDPRVKLEAIIDMLTNELPEMAGKIEFNRNYLYHIVIVESSKAFLIKDVLEINQQQVFKPYKDLCQTMAEVINEIDPQYPYAHSLSSTLVETAHSQQYFVENLPRLTDVDMVTTPAYTKSFLWNLVTKVLLI
ncbi:MAG: TetR/AcrR family transcriptional regulator [Saprospiraceae bacterium]|nr:TetR/AcrR family transcriptional regulator [Saprospiraceae bacterium]